LLVYFNQRNTVTWYRHFKLYGFKKVEHGKNKGMMFNEHFHKDMGKADFEAMFRYRDRFKALLKQEKTVKAVKAAARVDKTNAIASKANQEKAAKTTSKFTKKKSKATKATKVTKKGKTETKPTSGGKSASPASNKKRKKPSDSSDVVDNAQRKKKKASAGSKKKEKGVDHALRKKVRVYRCFIQNYFWKWGMWNYPPGLHTLLENQTFMNNSKRKKAPDAAAACDAEPELRCCDDDPDEKNAKFLLCDEELPDSVTNERDEEEALADFVDRIRRNNSHREKLEEAWSKAVAPEVEGKTLPQSKFAKPTDRWRKLKVGDRVAIYWRNDGEFYNATIQKQQLNTRYFHLLYEDDGISEWLDMSREFFRLLNEEKKPKSSVAATSTPQRPRRQSLSRVSDTTPRMDNRASSIEKKNTEELDPTNLPESHAHLAPYVRPSWKGLGLGVDSGTPAYNAFVRERDASAPKATAVDLLNDLRGIRLWGFSGIPLRLDDENTSKETSGEIADAEALDSNEALLNQLRDLDDRISKDNDVAYSTKYFEKNLNAAREVTDKWSAATVRDNLKALETEHLKLNERESRILGKCKEEGLL